MRLRTIRCFLYDSEASALLIQGLVRYIQTGSLKNVILQKSWVNGFHISTTTPVSEACSGLEDLIRRMAARYAKERSREEYDGFRETLHKLAKRETYTGDYLPLFRDGEVIVEENDLLPGGVPFCSPRINYRVELLKSQLLTDIYHEWEELPEERQNIECAKMFLITGSRSPGGLKTGYLPLRSNCGGFKSLRGMIGQEAIADADIREGLLLRTDLEKEFIAEGVRKFSNGYFEREFIFGRLRIFIHSLSSMLTRAYNEGELEVEKLSLGDHFLEGHDRMNEVHRMLYSNPWFLRHYREKGFIINRCVASVLYSLMSMLGISPPRHQKIIGLTAECVESGFNMDWRDAYRHLEMKLAGETEYGKLVY
ncbi:hypothetical protein G8C92_20100 [Paenibacillus donghaensis]|uniref:hypothetical protein n=1 Tax=Paenibacillus donghaensis TaxID=414771 RepID=UPI0018841E36|nr:hypothetical protein [Paenibacillus donghaensis]MBE9916323.1 hypothetical protein [Paenibacillus donghaensis]